MLWPKLLVSSDYLFVCYSLAVKGNQDNASKGKDSNNLDSFNCDGEPP